MLSIHHIESLEVGEIGVNWITLKFKPKHDWDEPLKVTFFTRQYNTFEIVDALATELRGAFARFNDRLEAADQAAEADRREADRELAQDEIPF